LSSLLCLWLLLSADISFL
jgi:cytochrome P450